MAVRRSARAVAALGCALFAGVTAPVSAAPGCPGVAERPDGWTGIRVPNAPTAYAATDRTLLVTDGTTVVRSADGGCTWTPVFAVSGALPRTVRDVRVTWTDSGTPTSWLLVEERVGAVLGRPLVYVSDDGGVTWREASAGLPPVGDPVALRPAPLAVGVAYLAVRESPTRTVTFYRTIDGGRNWTRQAYAGDAGQAPTDVADFVVNPRDQHDVWAWGPGRLYRSLDAGGRFRYAGPTGGAPSTVEVVPAPVDEAGGSWRVILFYPDGTSRTSRDGLAWTAGRELGGVTSAASLPVVTDLYATASASGVRVVGRAGVSVVTPGVPVGRLSFSGGREPLLHAMTTTGLLRRPLDTPQRPDRDEYVGTLRAARPRAGAPELEPAATDLTLPVGERRRVDYTLRLPPAPTPVDVYFLSDTTSSMSSVVTALRRDYVDIVNDLADHGITVWFGVGDFREYAEYGLHESVDNYPYRRRRAVGPVDAGLRAAIASLSTGGGATDGSSSALEALYQAATGAGRYPAGAAPVAPIVPPGHDAGFRKDALKIVVLATDTAWRDARPGYPGPSEQQVFRALAERDIHVVGLAIGFPDRDPSDGQVGGPGPDLREVATATKTFAPPGGLDCDGDGVRDLNAGEPLLCALPTSFETSNLGTAIVAMLRAVGKRAPVSLALGGGAGVARPAAPLGVPAIDLKAANDLRFPIDFHCAAAGDHHVTLTARVAGRVVAGATASVRCVDTVAGGTVPPVLPPPRVPPAPGSGLAAAPPQPPPPLNNPQLEPNAQLHPNTGLAPEDEEQPQLTPATEQVPADPALLLATGLVLAVAAGVAFRRRVATAPAARSRG